MAFEIINLLTYLLTIMCGKKQSGYVQVRREWTDDIYDKLKICTRVKLLCRRQKQMKQDNY